MSRRRAAYRPRDQEPFDADPIVSRTYQTEIWQEDRPVFDQCTDTIVRQVDDIRRMVDEFSKFARMPKPVIEGEDVADTVRQAAFLMKVAHPELEIETDI